MTTFRPRLVRSATIVMAFLILGGSLFWDGWSFSGPMFRYSVWLQPSVFVLSLVILAYSFMSRAEQDRTAVLETVRFEN